MAMSKDEIAELQRQIEVGETTIYLDNNAYIKWTDGVLKLPSTSRTV